MARNDAKPARTLVGVGVLALKSFPTIAANMCDRGEAVLLRLCSPFDVLWLQSGGEIIEYALSGDHHRSAAKLLPTTVSVKRRTRDFI